MDERERDLATNRLLEIIRGSRKPGAIPTSPGEPQPPAEKTPPSPEERKRPPTAPPRPSPVKIGERREEEAVAVREVPPPVASSQSPPLPPASEVEEAIADALLPLPARILKRLTRKTRLPVPQKPPKVKFKPAREKREKALVKPAPKLIKERAKKPQAVKGVVAVDIGSASLKVVEIVRKGGNYYLSNLQYISIPSGIRKSASGLPIFIAKNLKELFPSSRRKRAQVRLVLPDRSALAKRVSVPGGAGKELLNAIRFQLKKEAPFPIESAQIAYTGWKRGVKGKQELEVLAVDGAVLEERSQWCANAELTPVQFTAPVVCYPELVQEYAEVEAEKGAVVIVDIGATKTTITIVEKGKTQLSRTIMTGGDDFTAALIGAAVGPEGSELTEVQAEQFKREVGIPAEAVPRGMKIAILLRPIVERISNEINRLVELYRREEGSDVVKILLCGGGALLKRLPELIAQNVGIEVIVTNPMGRLQPSSGQVEELMAKCSEWGPAFIPALAVALSPPQHFNILPQAIREEIKVQRWKRMVAPAALGLMILLVLSYSELLIRNAMVVSKLRNLTSELKDLDQVRAQYFATNAQLQSALSSWNEKKGEYDALKEEDPAMVGYLKAISQVVPEHIYLTFLQTTYRTPPSSPAGTGRSDTLRAIAESPMVVSLANPREALARSMASLVGSGQGATAPADTAQSPMLKRNVYGRLLTLEGFSYPAGDLTDVYLVNFVFTLENTGQFREVVVDSIKRLDDGKLFFRILCGL